MSYHVYFSAYIQRLILFPTALFIQYTFVTYAYAVWNDFILKKYTNITILKLWDLFITFLVLNNLNHGRHIHKLFRVISICFLAISKMRLYFFMANSLSKGNNLGSLRDHCNYIYVSVTSYHTLLKKHLHVIIRKRFWFFFYVINIVARGKFSLDHISFIFMYQSWQRNGYL